MGRELAPSPLQGEGWGEGEITKTSEVSTKANQANWEQNLRGLQKNLVAIQNLFHAKIGSFLKNEPI